MTVRAFHSFDYGIFSEWRGGTAPPESVLPAGGFVALDGDNRPCGTLHCYLDNSRGVAFPEWLTLAPWLSISGKLAAGRVLLLVVEEWLRSMGYQLMFVKTFVRGMAPALRRLGFQHDPSEPALTSLWKEIP